MDQLEAFGYSCKLFPDSEAARHVNEEKHLHPHELDLLATIDRYELVFPVFDYHLLVVAFKPTGDQTG